MSKSTEIPKQQTQEQKDENDFRFAWNPPVWKTTVRPNRESIKLSHDKSLFIGTYPRKVSNDDNLKFLYLKKLVRKQEISPDRFIELAKMLKINEKEEKIYCTIGEIIQLF